jgi:hypothetical protein
MFEIWIRRQDHWSWYYIGIEDREGLLRELGRLDVTFDELRVVTREEDRPGELW